ncbi:unnamed protein product [Callosobruchus maculatus]|uniref:Uncharacterized protein n=1 Tax=Callosobruchus maculatus TaxID=64391 RepID=A0A653BJQ9_CALMS|nr:unnamed protein product [Callosobruchus maculatus]
MADKLNAEFWSVSSRTGENLNDMFNRVAALAFDKIMMKTHEGPILQIPIGKSLIDLNRIEPRGARRGCLPSGCQ